MGSRGRRVGGFHEFARRLAMRKIHIRLSGTAVKAAAGFVALPEKAKLSRLAPAAFPPLATTHPREPLAIFVPAGRLPIGGLSFHFDEHVTPDLVV